MLRKTQEIIPKTKSCLIQQQGSFFSKHSKNPAIRFSPLEIQFYLLADKFHASEIKLWHLAAKFQSAEIKFSNSEIHFPHSEIHFHSLAAPAKVQQLVFNAPQLIYHSPKPRKIRKT